MNRILTIIILTFSNILIAQSIEIYHGKYFNGSIFPENYKNKSYNWLDDNKRFTPTFEEIEKFENGLRIKLKQINTKLWNQKQTSCPVIHKNLKNYNRQYLGFIDNSGKKYLLVNFLWKDKFEEKQNDEFYDELGDWKKNWQVWFDGCSHFWNVKYYLESDTLFDLQINGSA